MEMRERAKADIRESMVGTETFEPKHIIVATWKNVSFAGGIPLARRTVSVFYLLLNLIYSANELKAICKMNIAEQMAFLLSMN